MLTLQPHVGSQLPLALIHRSKKKRRDEGAGAKEAKETVENLLSWMEIAVEEDQKANEQGAEE